MPATAESLRELHQLHQRAKALRDRLTSAPKILAARQAALAKREVDRDDARKALQDAKVHLKKMEHSLQALEAKIDDLRVKLNQVKRNEEYKAIQNQIAHDQSAKGKLEDEILETLGAIETQAAALATREAEFKALEAGVAALQRQVESQAAGQKTQLQELETAIVEAEAIIPEDHRDRYRRVVKQHGADAMAFIESDACSGCNVSITAQMKNELINGEHITFCKTCGRLLYLAEEDIPNTRRS
ncbi:MAG TPA: C4-type zinc ribbon domain-containing protein [Isosphaeraceae bacterium]|nr:C4-type zinc ribbon domain-containing protein [Isosphaeraceae bacterium]